MLMKFLSPEIAIFFNFQEMFSVVVLPHPWSREKWINWVGSWHGCGVNGAGNGKKCQKDICLSVIKPQWNQYQSPVKWVSKYIFFYQDALKIVSKRFGPSCQGLNPECDCHVPLLNPLHLMAAPSGDHNGSNRAELRPILLTLFFQIQ